MAEGRFWYNSLNEREFKEQEEKASFGIGRVTTDDEERALRRYRADFESGQSGNAFLARVASL